jgi:hypothetical protein
MEAILPRTNFIRTLNSQILDTRADAIVEYARQYMPNPVATNRQNTDIGDQFSYLWSGDRDRHVFTFVAQLANSSYFVGLSWPNDEDHAQMEGGRLHSED